MREGGIRTTGARVLRASMAIKSGWGQIQPDLFIYITSFVVVVVVVVFRQTGTVYLVFSTATTF